MYSFTEKRLVVVLLVMLRSLLMFSQQSTDVTSPLRIQADTSRERRAISRLLPFPADTIVIDTLINLKKISTDAIDKKVIYSAPGGYIKNDLVNKKATIVKNGIVNYGDIEIKADSIVFDMETNEVYAVGIFDSLGVITGKPAFKSGSEEFESDTLRYNFKTKKAIVKNIITQQEEGYLHSRVTKLLEDGTSNIYKNTYSTCDLDTPHFYIKLQRAKLYPGKKIVSGPGNLVLEGIPLPLYLPFGYFPIQTKKAASGFRIPKVHYEAARGYALTDGGYYFAINNYFDLSLTGSIFTNGSWLANAQTTYNKRYKYNGNFSFSYAKNVSGHKGLQDESTQKNYNVGWTFSQNAKARPGSRFSASVNMSSAGYDRNNSYNLNDHINTTRQSSISYTKTFTGTPFNFSASMNHSQNVRNKTVSLDLPKMNLNASRIYPLKGKRQVGPTKWWQELSFQYSASLDNQISTSDSLLFTNAVWEKMRSGFSHEAPLSLQIRPFKNFSISPSVSYKGVLYTQKVERRWDPDLNAVVYDTLRGSFYGQALNPSISAGYSPQIFGMYDFINPDSRVDAIRHVMKPSVSFSYVPSFSGLSSKMFRQVQIDTSGKKFSDYSIYDGNIYGTPSLSKRSGNVSFNLTNLLEAKVFARDDTTGKPKKVSLIDNLGISTSYNIFADSLKWSPISMVMRTTLFQNISLSASGSLSLYGLDSKGRQIGTFYFQQNGKLLRLNNLNVSLDFSVSDLLKSKDAKKTTASSQSSRAVRTTEDGIAGANLAGASVTGSGAGDSEFDEYGYMKFNTPWSMDVSYSVSYTKPALKATISQALTVRGHIQLTKKMNITYNTGYDFTAKAITMTQLSFTRDLHCWNMSFNWVPNGNMKMWEFAIRVNASVLQDLKYERRKDYHDTY
ncbi:MAG: putative LPS assembly protein LptD [Bacteroidia bacterium]|nr:putative LPS assembly protein LptD [Bacteroidia bacterium]